MNYSLILLAGAALFFACVPRLNAQLTVTPAGDVGIGTTTPNAKLHVVKDTANNPYLAYFLNNSAPAGYKYGVYNYVTSAGSSGRYGLLNLTYSSASSGSSLGFYNATSGHQGSTYGAYNYTAQSGTTGTVYGLYNYTNSNTSSSAYGIYSNMLTSTGTGIRYGVYTTISGTGTGTQYGLYASASGAGNFAGYFNGNVQVTGSFTVTSDARKKKNVEDVNGAIDILGQLRARSYEFVEDENMNLPEGRQYGFLAQELEEVLPELVRTIENPEVNDEVNVEPLSEETARKGELPEIKEGKELKSETLKSVNYISLIPILVQAVNEQQEVIRTQAERIEAQEAAIRSLQEQIGK